MPPLNLYARVRLSYVHFAHETAGAARTRLSLRPLRFQRATRLQNLGPFAPRDRGHVDYRFPRSLTENAANEMQPYRETRHARPSAVLPRPCFTKQEDRTSQEISYTDTLSAMPLKATLLRVGFSPLVSSRVRVSAFSTTYSVTTIEREAARPWTREAMFTVWPK